MQPSDRGDAADHTDQEAAEMGRILVLGAAVGFPLVFVITLLLVLAAGARGAGTIFIAAWGALIGGTFIGAGVLLAKRLGNLGSPEQSVKASVPPAPEGAVRGPSPSGRDLHHAVEG
jgi:hypothetical protein